VRQLPVSLAWRAAPRQLLLAILKNRLETCSKSALTECVMRSGFRRMFPIPRIMHFVMGLFRRNVIVLGAHPKTKDVSVLEASSPKGAMWAHR